MSKIKTVRSFIDSIPWPVAVAAALTLGLAPFSPRPHFVEKLEMLRSGLLRRPLDLFDLALHGTPWLVLSLKVLASALVPKNQGSRPR